MEIPLQFVYLKKLHLSGVPTGATLSLFGYDICELAEGNNTVDFTEIYAEIHRKERAFSLLSEEERATAPQAIRLNGSEVMLAIVNDCPSYRSEIPAEPGITFSGLNIKRIHESLIVLPAAAGITYRFEF